MCLASQMADKRTRLCDQRGVALTEVSGKVRRDVGVSDVVVRQLGAPDVKWANAQCQCERLGCE